MFTTKGTTDKPVSNYIKPGINDNVVIDAITANTEGTDYVEFAFRLADAPEANTTKTRIYLSEAAKARSFTKIKHIANRFVDEEQIDGIAAATTAEYAAALSKLVCGKKPIRMKFCGEEYTNASGETKYKSTIGLPPFAELMTENPTKLKYNENNQYDFKRLAKADVDATTTTSGAATDDLPF